jgi:dienelactone hydrolase
VKLTYQAEEDDTVNAYLLVPRCSEPPFPGIVAHHQCNIDCDLGKEAVVGKVPERADQAYGLELVRRGFVVLAPDSVNCGERFVKSVREEGECIKTEEWKLSHCWGALKPKLSTRHIYTKHLYDSVRAIDYLSSLDDLVDPDKIGMIGHSLGAGTTFWTAAYDYRLKAAVASCHYLGGMDNYGLPIWYPKAPESEGLWYHEILEIIAPTPYLATRGVDEDLQGRFDTKEKNLKAQRWAFEYGSYVYSLHGAGEDAIRTRIFDGGHEFPPQVREKCYEFIEKHLSSF